MNKYFICLAIIFLMACGEKKVNSVIQGTWNRKTVENLHLFKIENGGLKHVLSAKPDEDGKFSFDFEPGCEGFYVIGPRRDYPLDNYTFYLKPGDDLQFIVNPEGYELIGENTPENVSLAQWEKYIFPVRDGAFNYNVNKGTYVEFFPLVEEKVADIGIFPDKPTRNKKFNQAFEKYKEFDLLFAAVYFLMTPRNVFPSEEDMTDFYKQIVLADLTQTEDVLEYPYGISLVSMIGINSLTKHVNNLPDEEKQSARSRLTPIYYITPLIVQDKIKGEFITEQIVRITNYETVQSIYKEFGKYLVTEEQEKKFLNYMQVLGKTAPGSPAIDFKFPDMEGNEVALSDFKGKVVYIDVWATWCGPCKQEIPHLVTLEKEYHGKDIIFMSVSTDAGKDFEKWKQMVIKENLKGIQLFAGDRSREEIINPYRIKGIPRFILIGKDGNIITNDAERPSSAEIRRILNAALAK